MLKNNNTVFCSNFFFCFTSTFFFLFVFFLNLLTLPNTAVGKVTNNGIKSVLILYSGELSKKYKTESFTNNVLKENGFEKIKENSESQEKEEIVIDLYKDAYLFTEDGRKFKIILYPYKVVTDKNTVHFKNVLAYIGSNDKISLTLDKEEKTGLTKQEDVNKTKWWDKIIQVEKVWRKVEEIIATATMESDTINVNITKNLVARTALPKYTLYITSGDKIEKWVNSLKILSPRINIIQLDATNLSRKLTPPFLTIDSLPCLSSYGIATLICKSNLIKFYLLKDIAMDSYVSGRRFSGHYFRIHSNKNTCEYLEKLHKTTGFTYPRCIKSKSREKDTTASINDVVVFSYKEIMFFLSYFNIHPNALNQFQNQMTKYGDILALKNKFLGNSWIAGKAIYNFKKEIKVKIKSIKMASQIEEEMKFKVGSDKGIGEINERNDKQLFELILELPECKSLFKVLTTL